MNAAQFGRSIKTLPSKQGISAGDGSKIIKNHPLPKSKEKMIDGRQ